MEGRGELGAAQAVNLKGSRRDIVRRHPQTDLLTKQAQRVTQTLQTSVSLHARSGLLVSNPKVTHRSGCFDNLIRKHVQSTGDRY